MIKTTQGTLYTGISTDVQRRFAEHAAQSNKTAKALRGKAPLELVFSAKLKSHSEALRAELWVKKQNKRNKLALITGGVSMPYEHLIIPANA